MTSLALFDILLRGASVALMLTIAVLLLRTAGWSRKTAAFLFAAIGFSAYVLVSSPNLSGLPPLSNTILVAFAGFGPVLAYWVVIELFDDQFLFRWWHGVFSVIIVLGAWGYDLWPWVGAIRGIAAVLLNLHLLYVVIAGVAGDLIQERRRFRGWFLLCVTLFALIIALTELVVDDQVISPLLFPLHAAVFVALSFAFLVWAMGLKSNIWIIGTTSETLKQPSGLNPADRAVLKRLETEMLSGIWKTESLTIRSLAAQINTPEHRLRELINKRLQYRNFPQYINEQRIKAAKAILDDPARAEIAILTIAYDVGFASLGPFNRAFRDVTGQSPTEYRRNS